MCLSKFTIFTLLVFLPSYAIAQTHPAGPSGAILQGGDDISSAFPIPNIPFSDYGTTTGYTDNYDGPCSGASGSAPDVVYSYSAADNEVLMISLCQSTDFDSRLYIFEDSPNNVVACNDDNCASVSRIDCVMLSAGHNYYIVIDGYGTNSGNYTLDIGQSEPAISISGTVRDSNSNSISGADIWILDAGGAPVWHDTTDTYGGYYANGFINGPYTIEASKAGYFPQIQGPVYPGACDRVVVDFMLASFGCIQITSPNAIIENEPICYDDYLDTLNGGCTYLAWDTIPPVCEYYGTSGDYNFEDATVRDADWLEFDLSDSGLVSLKGAAEFDMLIMIIKQGPTVPCDGFETIAWQLAPTCDTAYFDYYLAAGKYWIWVAPQAFDGVACGSKYYLSLQSQGYTNCDYVAGDLNHSGIFNGIDVTYAVAYFKGGVVPQYSCFCHGYVWFVEGDFNGDCVFNGLDIGYMVGFLKGFWGPRWCPDCPPRNSHF
jgi:hypothetical protein